MVYSAVSAVMLSSDAEVSIHRQTETGTPTATSPISTGIMVQEQNGEIMPRAIASR